MVPSTASLFAHAWVTRAIECSIRYFGHMIEERVSDENVSRP